MRQGRRLRNPRGFAQRLRVMHAGGRQHIAGVVVNTRPNVPRSEIERLEAILYNCVRYGPESQNRAALADFRAHLEGRVAWVAQLNPQRAERLKALLHGIAWS
jgi:RNA-directed DNA polymerase